MYDNRYKSHVTTGITQELTFGCVRNILYESLLNIYYIASMNHVIYVSKYFDFKYQIICLKNVVVLSLETCVSILMVVGATSHLCHILGWHGSMVLPSHQLMSHAKQSVGFNEAWALCMSIG